MGRGMCRQHLLLQSTTHSQDVFSREVAHRPFSRLQDGCVEVVLRSEDDSAGEGPLF